MRRTRGEEGEGKEQGEREREKDRDLVRERDTRNREREMQIGERGTKGKRERHSPVVVLECVRACALCFQY